MLLIYISAVQGVTLVHYFADGPAPTVRGQDVIGKRLGQLKEAIENVFKDQINDNNKVLQEMRTLPPPGG